MKLPYMLWWLNYSVNSMEKEDLLRSFTGVVKDLRKEVPDYDKLEKALREGESYLNLIEENLDKYEKSGNESYLGELQENNNILTVIFNDVFRETEFFRNIMPVTEKEFMLEEAVERVNSSGIILFLEHVIEGWFNKTIPEEALWNYLDELRDTIYETEEEVIGDITGRGTDKRDSEEIDPEYPECADIFERVTEELEEGLDIIERSFKENNYALSLEGYRKIKRCLIDNKIIEMQSEVMK